MTAPDTDDTPGDLPAVDEHDPAFEHLLRHIKDSRRFDFTGYKRASLIRRVQRRMTAVGAGSYEEYLDRLEVDRDEFTALFNTVLINVTKFFRDKDVWNHLGDDLVPGLLRRKPTGLLRFWSAGCAGGHEAYSMAMVLHDALGEDEFRERVKIYATDVDDEAIAEARAATYPSTAVDHLPPDLVERHFERDGTSGALTVSKALRRAVIFGRNDLVQDAPISRVDLMLCRNTLMYFNSEQQNAILKRLHFALNPEGLLVLGKAEMVLGFGSQLEALDLKRRVFRRAAVYAARDSGDAVRRPSAAHSPDGAVNELRLATLTHAPTACLVVGDGRLVLANERAKALLGVSSRDTGRLFQDLEVSYRPVELRSAIEQAERERLPVWIRGVHWERVDRDAVILDIQVLPVTGITARTDGVAVYFTDVTRYQSMRDELERANRQVESAYEELRSTNEELETTNQELQSTIEELETTNEELQSTNEELEMMNEELQSMNDQFQIRNEELRSRTTEVAQINELLQTILPSLRGGVIVVDADLTVLVWNRQSEDLFGVNADEAVGKHLYGLRLGLPLHSLRPLVQRLLRPSSPSRRPGDGPPTGETVTMDAHDLHGGAFSVQVTGNPLLAVDGRVRGAVLVAEATSDPAPAAPPPVDGTPD